MNKAKAREWARMMMDWADNESRQIFWQSQP